MNIGILKETAKFETRVAISPEIVKKLISLNHTVSIESGIESENELKDAGATINSDFSNVDIYFKVNAPNENELDNMKEGSSLITFFQIIRYVNDFCFIS